MLGCRDPLDKQDVWIALDATTGESRWRLSYEAPGKMDYGASPRATPVLRDGRAYLLGAFGHLHCVDLATGITRWNVDLAATYRAEPRVWGHAATPLVVDDLLLVQPGGKTASLVGLSLQDGAERWKTPGAPAGHAAFVLATDLTGRRQAIGYDEKTLGGWDPTTGVRLWTLVPKEPGDFNVPSPIATDTGLLVFTENNGTRLYAFAPDGRLDPEPRAQFAKLAPDSHSPVLVAGRLFGIKDALYALDAATLEPAWIWKDRIFRNHSSVIASADKALVVTYRGEALLFDARSNESKPVSRLPLTDDRTVECWSHPAVAGGRLYVRLGDKLACLDLKP